MKQAIHAFNEAQKIALIYLEEIKDAVRDTMNSSGPQGQPRYVVKWGDYADMERTTNALKEIRDRLLHLGEYAE